MSLNLSRRHFLGAGLLLASSVKNLLASPEKQLMQNLSEPNSFLFPPGLDEQSKAFLRQMQAAPKLYRLSVAEARDRLKTVSRDFDAPYTEIAKTADILIDGAAHKIPLRIYWPDNSESRHPVLLMYHGGGFILGDIDTHDRMARYFCRHANAIVINVGYGLAPEHKFPTGVEDAYAALVWAETNRDANANGKLAVIGDSAGGNIAAVVAQLAKTRNGPSIDYQVLLYPSTTMNPVTHYESHQLYGNGEFFVSKQDKAWHRSLYFDDPAQQMLDSRASPILTEDLSGLPPALIITAGFDMLRDEAKHYAERLINANVNTEYRCFHSTIHGFMSFPGLLDTGKEGLDFVSRRIRQTLSSS